LIDFDAVSEFIIPRQAFCNRYITVRDPTGEYRILGHPVCINTEKYDRNEFIFNFGLIVKVDYDTIPYEAVVRRLAITFTEMEIQNQYLSLEGTLESRGRRSIGALLEIIREDLNNYNECMIPVGEASFFSRLNPFERSEQTPNEIDDANTINMKLFPAHPDPPVVKSWHVPISKVKLADLVDDRWDLTLRKIIPEINGVNDVRRIAHNAGVSLDLTKLALQHLLYYQTIIMLDLFLFGNIYAVMPAITDFVNNLDDIQDECGDYVFRSNLRLSNYDLCRLFTSFSHGRSIKDWLKLHADEGRDVFRYVDIRRLVQFGVIKGLIRLVNKYAVSSQYLASLAQGDTRDDASDQVVNNGGEVASSLLKYTDGCHSFNQIICEMDMSESDIRKELGRMQPLADVQIMYR
jgi:nitrogen permease regulator 2-like protein